MLLRRKKVIFVSIFLFGTYIIITRQLKSLENQGEHVKAFALHKPATTNHQVNTPATTHHQVNTPATTHHQVNTPATTHHQVNTPATTHHQVNTKDVKFKDVNTGRIETLHWVCIHSNHPSYKLGNDGIKYYWWINGTKHLLHGKECVKIPQKSITVYTSDEKSRPDIANIAGFYVNYSNKSIPADYKIVEDKTAYFNGITHLAFQPHNFFHFLKQIFVPFYHMIETTNQLGPGAQNLGFYAKPWGQCPGKFIPFKTDKFQVFFDMLNIHEQYNSVYEENEYPDKVCYKNAAFTKSLHLPHAKKALNYILEKLHIDRTSCSDRRLTLVQRGLYRKILNINELKAVGTAMGYNVDIVTMETLTLKQQAQLIYCTEVLVGVTGAGLVWSFLMRENSGVVEIAWPSKDWPYFFTGSGKYNSGMRHIMPLNWAQLEAATCVMNTTYVNKFYRDIFLTDGSFSEAEIQSIIADKRNYDFSKSKVTAIGKLCDITINPEDFRKAVLKAKATYNTDKTTQLKPKRARSLLNA